MFCLIKPVVLLLLSACFYDLVLSHSRTTRTWMTSVSLDTEKEARKLTNDTVLKTGRFKVKDWISNKMLKEKVNGDVEKEI